ncbi:HNH endonuclease [Novosphingobium guangzhouense]|uniref:HNH endonuclease n=1 Tax=Novosphingobium guangzhouense TaxID=1850347 RepID=A0A2K2G1P9_9SPHN|nr:HNH endonuclease [Novosphingobium guangzhouense]PNU04908.1 HNH endonuclease [Novosphingobium guangzhouense]
MDDAATICWLCRRPLGRKVEWHHPIPKSRGGRLTVPLHPICHRAIHASLSNAQLARMAPQPASLLEVEEIARFVRWVAGKPPDFHAPTRRKR